MNSFIKSFLVSKIDYYKQQIHQNLRFILSPIYRLFILITHYNIWLYYRIIKSYSKIMAYDLLYSFCYTFSMLPHLTLRIK